MFLLLFYNPSKMLYMACPTCGTCLGDKELLYEKDWQRILHNEKLSDDEKSQARAKIFEKLEVKRYCCKMRLMSFIHEEELLAQRRP